MLVRFEVNRFMLGLAGMCGAIGVALAAAATHRGEADLGIAANFLLFHAPTLLGISFLARNRLSLIAGAVLIVGLVLFAGDLTVRALNGTSPFPIAAPIGGTGMIAGWVLLAISAVVGWPKPENR
ncbi:MAG TPA: DUF423 domain-containing protein [Devosiaceae bacterium]|nr:DUF423 domain-containing protein [Devosiaceae bacterium]